ncbi:MAG: hypothetical protein J6E46_10730 [Faecalicoccus sp.]|nr:hypothetical protein [Faecalicoccus sp.]
MKKILAALLAFLLLLSGCAASQNKHVGEWQSIKSYLDDGSSSDWDEFSVVINNDKTGTMDFMGDKYDFTWTEHEDPEGLDIDGKIFIGAAKIAENGHLLFAVQVQDTASYFECVKK